MKPCSYSFMYDQMGHTYEVRGLFGYFHLLFDLELDLKTFLIRSVVPCFAASFILLTTLSIIDSFLTRNYFGVIIASACLVVLVYISAFWRHKIQLDGVAK